MIMHETSVEEYSLSMLVIGEDRTTRERLWSTIRRMRVFADQAGSTSQALEMCEFYSYDVIFIDLRAPGLDGFETARLIRDLEGGSRDAYIVALFASVASRDYLTTCIKSGINDCLTAPLKRETLRSRVALWDRLNQAHMLKPMQV